jgi:hypothetical protein
MDIYDGDIQGDIRRLYSEKRWRIWLGRIWSFLKEWWFVIIVITALIFAIFKLL